MGSTSIEKPKHPKLFMDALYAEDGDVVLRSVIISLREYYAAIKTSDGLVYAAIAKLDYKPNEKHSFTFRDMTEFDGPVYYNCPMSILLLLSETTDPLALSWRENCNIVARGKVELALKRRLVHDGSKLNVMGEVYTALWEGRNIVLVDKNKKRWRLQRSMDFEIVGDR